MPIEIVSGTRERRGAQSVDTKAVEALSQSTATNYQNINLWVDTVRLGMGTATGFEINRYRLATGAVEMQEVAFVVTATGEANLYLQNGTATGLWVFTQPDQFLLTKYVNNKWMVVVSSATLSTGTDGDFIMVSST